MIIENLKLVYSRHSSYVVTAISSILLGAVLFYFTYYDLMVGNLGVIYANIQVLVQIILSILFGINMAVLYYKFNTSQKLNTKETGSLTTASFFGLLVSGCPSCGITLASYLGLTSFFSTLPFLGIEFKLLAILLILYSLNSLLKTLTICKV